MSEAVAGIARSQARREVLLWIAQRASAVVLAFCVVVHLVTIFLAVRQGLTAAAIMGRLHASPAWVAFYVLFATAVCIHAPIGARAILAEWAGLRGRGVDGALALVALGLLALALRAIAGLAA